MVTWIKCSWSFRREVTFTNAIVEFGLNQFIRDRQHMNELMAKMEKDERSDQMMKQSMDLLPPGARFVVCDIERLSA